MSEATELMISDLQIGEFSNQELEAVFQKVLVEHKDAVKSIHQSMADSDEIFRKYLEPDFIPIEEEAKKDRAKLNAAERNIAEKFGSLKSAYERPLEKIELNIRAIRKAISNASSVVDSKVKSYEDARKAGKMDEIRNYFNSRNFDLVPLEKIFDERWLNKTVYMKEIKEKIDLMIQDIYKEIEVFETIPDYGQAAKAFYLDTLDMGAALRQIETLKRNAEKLAREQANREERKIQEQVALNKETLREDVKEAKKDELIKSMVEDALELPVGEPAEEILEFTLSFKGTKEQLLKLREYMSEIGIPYRKVFVFNNDRDAAVFMRQRNIKESIKSAVFVSKEAV